MSASPAPFAGHTDVVRPEWIDFNDHLNMGYYVVIFDFATDAWLDHIGLSASDRERMRVTTFTLESHVSYLREIRGEAPLRFTTRLLGFDRKRIHYFHEMYHATEGYLAATNELMTLHVSQDTRRSHPMEPDVLHRLTEILESHRELPVPPQVGRSIGLDQRPK